MFVDKAKIYIKAGDGGDGCVSFRREKYVPDGGPDGGDGGNGGNVIFIADSNMKTLMDYKYKRKHVAKNGEMGGKNNRYGKSAKDLHIRVPAGTIIKDADNNIVLADLKKENSQYVAAKGGNGGKGNAKFATPTRQTPRFAKLGKKGEEKNIELELKLIADVGLVGLPNVGKSTLLSIATAAKPKIADYHFTTLSPNLGVVELSDNRTFVMADIPGLIEGAHEGAGLGHSFLRHIERTKMIIHVLDISGVEGRDPLEDFKNINEELRLYSEKLATKVQVVACNKMDIPGAETNYKHVQSILSNEGYEVFPISGATKQGVTTLLDKVYNMLDEIVEEEIIEDASEFVFYEDKSVKEYNIKIDGNTFIIEGKFVDRILASINIHDSESLKHFQKILIKKGIIDELRHKGIKNGDTVKMNEHEFDYFD